MHQPTPIDDTEKEQHARYGLSQLVSGHERPQDPVNYNGGHDTDGKGGSPNDGHHSCRRGLRCVDEPERYDGEGQAANYSGALLRLD